MPLENLPAWDSMIGVQVKNLILNKRELLLKELDVSPLRIVADIPSSHFATKTHIQKIAALFLRGCNNGHSYCA